MEAVSLNEKRRPRIMSKRVAGKKIDISTLLKIEDLLVVDEVFIRAFLALRDADEITRVR